MEEQIYYIAGFNNVPFFLVAVIAIFQALFIQGRFSGLPYSAELVALS